MCLSKLVALCITRHMKWNRMPLCSMLPPKHEEVSHVQGFTVLEGAECINLPFTLEAISWYPNYWMPIKLIYAVTHTFLEWLHLIACISQGSLEKWASQVVLVVKNLPVRAGDVRDMGSIPGVRKIPWWRVQKPTPVILLGKSSGQRSLVGYSPQGGKESDTTEAT